MKNYWKSYSMLLTLALCSSTFLGFWTLEKDSCLQIDLIQEIKIKIGFCHLKDINK